MATITKPRLRRNLTYTSVEDKSSEERRDRSSRIDKPCHTNADSLFSTSSGFNNYRGLLNFCIILLALSNTRAALENLLKYGILVDPVSWIRAVMAHPYSWPSTSLIILLNLFILFALFVEKKLSSNLLSERVGCMLHMLNLFTILVFPATTVLILHPFPVFSSIALAAYTIMFLKLESYRQVNKWCRESRQSLKQDRNHFKLSRMQSVSSDTGLVWLPHNYDQDDLKKSYSLLNGKPDTLVQYPDNLNIQDIYYFTFAPTLCYELNFPRSSRIRKRFLIKRILEMVFLSQLILMLVQQWILPTVENAMEPFQSLHFTKMVERLLKLAVPNIVIWLIFFYAYFHSTLNVMAEVLKFGDRVFYRDWWNAESIEEFWKNWNIPVHRWASRHFYKPLLKLGVGKMKAAMSVFILSAFFHEYLVSIPLRMFRIWAFSAMLSQVPMAVLVRKYLHGQMGNFAVWISLIIGQPVAILMYYHDYFIDVIKQNV